MWYLKKGKREKVKEKKDKWIKNKYDIIWIIYYNLLYIDGNCIVFLDIIIFRLFDLKNFIVIVLVIKSVDEDWMLVLK